MNTQRRVRREPTLNFFNNRILIALTAFIFTYTQTVPISMAATFISVENPAPELQREKQAEAPAPVSAAPTVSPVLTSDQFLAEDSAIHKVAAETENSEEVSVPAAAEENDAAQETQNPIAAALQMMWNQTTDVVGAVVNTAKITVGELTEALKQIVSKGYEVFIGVVKGALTLISSKNPTEISLPKSISDEIHVNAAVVSHVHMEHEDPSEQDLDTAEVSGKDQYILNLKEDGSANAVLFNGNGILATNQINDYVAKINEALQATTGGVIAAAAEWLQPRLLEAVDTREYNDPTVLPGNPIISTFQSTSGNGQPDGFVTIDQSSTSLYRMNYNFSNQGSFGGSQINWASTAAGKADLSGTSNFIFKLATNNTCGVGVNCVKVEFVDTNNRLAAVHIQNLSTTMKEVTIPKSTLQASNPNVNFANIKYINFVEDSNLTNPDVGYLDIQTGGLYFEPRLNAAASGPVTDLTSNQVVVQELEPSGHNTVTAFTSVSTSKFTFNYDLANGAANDFSRWASGLMVFGTPFNLTTTDLTLSLKASGTAKIKIDITSGTGANARRMTVIAQGITNSAQFYKITKAFLDTGTVPSGFDASNITAVAIVVDDVSAGSTTASGPVEVVSAGLRTNYPIDPDATNPAITLAPVTSTGARPDLTAFSSFNNSNDFSNATVTLASQTFAQFDFNTYNTTSYAGVFLNYDNPATNDGNAATTSDIETINLNSVFPNGIVLGLDNGGTGLTEVNLEVTDINGKKDYVILKNIEGFGKRWKILTSQFDEVDATKIQAIALVSQGRLVGKTLKIDWGTFAFVPPIPADGTNPAITTVPTASWEQPDKPAFVGFASFNGSDDFSNMTVTSVSPTFQTMNMNLYNTASYGGAFINYDNPATNDNNAGTTSDIETINLTTAFPNGIVLGLDNGGTGLSEAVLEVTDINGKKDSVKLVGIATTGQRWKVLTSQFDEVDLTKVQSLALVVTGKQVGKKLNVDWGNFLAPQSSDATNPAIQKLPANSLGSRPQTAAFASFNPNDPVPANRDFSNATLTLASQTFGTVDMNLYNTNSYGGVFVNYDNLATDDGNPATTNDIETINLDTAFPNGLVFGLDNGGTDITEVYLEVKDITGKTDQVWLGGIQDFGKRWKVLTSQLDDVDRTKIQTISLVVKGRHVGGKLNVDWGDFGGFVPPIPADGSNPAITPAPLASWDQDKPALTGFASYNPNDPVPANRDFSTTTVSALSATFQVIDFNLYNSFSFGGAFINYDNPATNDNNAGTTSDIETINLNTAFPNGIVLGLDNGNTGLSDVTLEVTDINGKKDTVKLTGIVDTGKRWKILVNQFDEVDVTKIQTVALLETGRQVAKKLNVDWGNFLAPQSSDATNPAIQKLPANSLGNRPGTGGFSSFNSNGTDYSNATLTLASQTFATVDMNLYNTNSYGGVYVLYDNPATNDNNPATTSDIETINLNTAFPNGIIFSLDNGGTNLTEAFLEITDITGKTDQVWLGGIQNFGKRWKVLVSQFDDADATKVQVISLVVKGRHVGVKLNVDWGDFGGFVPPIASDNSNPTITTLPVTSTGARVDTTAFTSNNPSQGDYSNASTILFSKNSAQLNFNTYNTTSYGGVFMNYDNPATNDNNPATTSDIEIINLNTVFPDGIVLGLDNGGSGVTDATLEVTDINGRKDTVKLTGITDTAKRWKILVNQFDEIDATKVQSIALVEAGRILSGRLNINWGDFNYVPSVDADGTNPSITPVPQNSLGNRPSLNAFASFNPNDPDPAKRDFSNATTNLTSPSQGKISMNLYNSFSYGGAYIDYDDPATNDNNAATTSDIESINLNTAFANGIVLELSTNDNTLTQVKIEITDVNGKKDIVSLNGIAAAAKRWKILPSLFDEADVTKVKTISIVVEGRHVGADLNFQWGDFDFTPAIP